MKYKTNFSTLIAALGLIGANSADACTGITLKSKDNSVIVARTIDWSGSEMDNMYTIVPRNHTQQSLLPNNGTDGMRFTSKNHNLLLTEQTRQAFPPHCFISRNMVNIGRIILNIKIEQLLTFSWFHGFCHSFLRLTKSKRPSKTFALLT